MSNQRICSFLYPTSYHSLLPVERKIQDIVSHGDDPIQGEPPHQCLQPAWYKGRGWKSGDRGRDIVINAAKYVLLTPSTLWSVWLLYVSYRFADHFVRCILGVGHTHRLDIVKHSSQDSEIR